MLAEQIDSKLGASLAGMAKTTVSASKEKILNQKISLI